VSASLAGRASPVDKCTTQAPLRLVHTRSLGCHEPTADSASSPDLQPDTSGVTHRNRHTIATPAAAPGHACSCTHSHACNTPLGRPLLPLTARQLTSLIGIGLLMGVVLRSMSATLSRGRGQAKTMTCCLILCGADGVHISTLSTLPVPSTSRALVSMHDIIVVNGAGVNVHCHAHCRPLPRPLPLYLNTAAPTYAPGKYSFHLFDLLAASWG
jgi:hypothetical protein